MTSFHITPATGNPAVCTAAPGQCPLGTHKPTVEEARAFYERLMADFTIPVPMTRANTRRG